MEEKNENEKLADEIMECCREMKALVNRMSDIAARLRKGSETESRPAVRQQTARPHTAGTYNPPAPDLLEDYPAPDMSALQEEAEADGKTIVDMLAASGIKGTVLKATSGPTLTRYDVEVAADQLDRAEMLWPQLSLALRRDSVITYRDQSQNLLYVEVPNKVRCTVGLKEMLCSPDYMDAKPRSRTFVLGKTTDGECVCADMTNLPHLLMAGASGSGAVVALDCMILSLVYRYSPQDLRLILVDPKQVEFAPFRGLPHLLVPDIISETSQAVNALRWAVREMDRRYELFSAMSREGRRVRDIDGYNARLGPDGEKLPRIAIIIFAFGNLMLMDRKGIEEGVMKLARRGRAAGIHLILATQGNLKDSITDAIKASMPARICFKVAQPSDSVAVLDCLGADNLLGQGDMYYISSGRDNMMYRIQGCFVSSEEIRRVVDYVREHNEAAYDQSIADFINSGAE